MRNTGTFLTENSDGQNLTCYHAQITIFSCKFVILAIFKIFIKQMEKEAFWMRSKIVSLYDVLMFYTVFQFVTLY